MKTPCIKSIGRSPMRHGLPRVQPIWILRGLLLIPLVLVCLALPPRAEAVCEEGCDTNNNTFLGDGALSSTTTGVANTATGSSALFRNTEGSNNTASGSGALTNNTTGSDNTAIGIGALSRNTTANSNTATGAFALAVNTTGYRNTAIGYAALSRNATGLGNTAIGFQALSQNFGSNNIGLGFNAGSNLTTAVATSVSVTMFWELVARATPPGSATFTPRSPLPGQFTSIPIIRSALLSPRAGSRRRSSPWTRLVKRSWGSNRLASVIKRRSNPMAPSCLDSSPRT